MLQKDGAAEQRAIVKAETDDPSPVGQYPMPFAALLSAVLVEMASSTAFGIAALAALASARISWSYSLE